MTWILTVLLIALAPLCLRAEPLTLAQCIERALAHNGNILVAEQGVLRAEADLHSTRANLLPSANLTVLNFNRSRTGPSIRVQDNPTGEIDPLTGQRIFAEEVTQIPGIDRNSYTFSASVNHTFYDGGRGRNNHRANKRNLLGAEKDLEARRDEIVFQTKQSYYRLLQNRELVEVQKEALKLDGKQLENARARLEVGSGTEVDVLRLQVALENSQAELVNAEQSVLLARANLNFLMGESIAAPLVLAAAPPTPVQSPEGGSGPLLERAFERNPTLEQLRLQQQAAELSLKAARGAWHPQLSGSASYSRNNEVFERVYRDLDQNYRINLGLSLSYNLFDGGLKRANIDRSRTAVEIARVNLEQQQRQIALAVETAYLEQVRLQKLLTIAERTAELAAKDLHLAQERYRVGKGRLLESLDAQVNFTQARSSAVRARYDLKIAEADLERLIGAD